MLIRYIKLPSQAFIWKNVKYFGMPNLIWSLEVFLFSNLTCVIVSLTKEIQATQSDILRNIFC